MNDIDIGDALKDHGMLLASEAEDRERAWWRHHALERLRDLAELSEFLDSDDLRDWGVEEPKHPNAWGSVWQKAVKEGWIEEAVGQQRRKSQRPTAHASKMTVYRSLIWCGF